MENKSLRSKDELHPKLDDNDREDIEYTEGLRAKKLPKGRYQNSKNPQSS